MKVIQAVVVSFLLFAGLQSQAFVLGTDYQTLVDAYNSTSVPAQVSDFNGAQKTCVAFKATTPEDVASIDYVVKCGKVLVPATPDTDIPAVPPRDIPAAGPLVPAQHVPGQPARHIPGTPQVCAPGTDLLLFGGDWIKDATPKQMSVFSETTSGADLVIGVAPNDQGIYDDVGKNVKFLIRRMNNYFPFLVTAMGQTIFAGYCY